MPAGEEGAEQLSDKAEAAQLDAALTPNLTRLGDSIVIVEGYSDQGPRRTAMSIPRTRAALVRDYSESEGFDLDPGAVGVMPLGGDAVGSPQGGGGTAWHWQCSSRSDRGPLRQLLILSFQQFS